MLNQPETSASTEPLLQVRDLAVSFSAGGAGRSMRAVDGVGLSLHARGMLAVVGESGCGKSVTALSILRLLPRDSARLDRGEILFGGRDLMRLTDRQMRSVRGGEIAMIFQEPMTSLNPVFTIGEQVTESVQLHRRVSHREALQIASDALQEVGIANAADRLAAYPHEFSGGMRQRVMIAMALACQPRVLLADEPTTALDVTVQAQILELISHLRRERGMAIMLITHDLGLVARHADTVCVMYAGRVMEYGPVVSVLERPMHPYTRALLACRPLLRERLPRLRTVPEIINNPDEFRPLSTGATPWWPARSACRDMALLEAEPTHWVACVSEPAAA